MQVKEVTVCRIFNTGNYENTRIEVRLALDPSDEANTSILTAEKIILDYWANKKEAKPLNNTENTKSLSLSSGSLLGKRKAQVQIPLGPATTFEGYFNAFL
jgi:hypothetical protein